MGTLKICASRTHEDRHRLFARCSAAFEMLLLRLRLSVEDVLRSCGCKYSMKPVPVPLIGDDVHAFRRQAGYSHSHAARSMCRRGSL